MQVAQPIAPVDHGKVTTSWDPKDGGTATTVVENDSFGATAAAIAPAFAGGVFAFHKASAAGRAAGAAAAAGGVEGAALARVVLKAQAPWMLGGAAIAGVGLIAGSVLGKHFGREETQTVKVTHEEYIDERLDDPDHRIGPESGIGSGVVNAASIMGGVAGMGLAGYALAGAPVPLRILGIMGGAVGGAIGSAVGANVLHAAISD